MKKNILCFNTILGNSPESRLFNNVREKKSLAYNISSSYSKNDGIMVIITGIDCDKYEVAIEAIKEELLVMQNGGFTNEELTSAKKLIISSLKEFEDFPSAIAEYYFAKDYLGNDDAKTAIKKIQNVTKEEIMNIAQKIKIDLIYLLKEQL